MFHLEDPFTTKLTHLDESFGQLFGCSEYDFARTGKGRSHSQTPRYETRRPLTSSTLTASFLELKIMIFFIQIKTCRRCNSATTFTVS